MRQRDEENGRSGFSGGQVVLGFLAGAAAGAVAAFLSASPWEQNVTSSTGFRRVDIVASPTFTRLDFFSPSGQQVLPSIGSSTTTPDTLDCQSNGVIIGIMTASSVPPEASTPVITSFVLICSNLSSSSVPRGDLFFLPPSPSLSLPPPPPPAPSPLSLPPPPPPFGGL